MTDPAETAYRKLAAVLERGRPTDSPYGPGAYLTWFVSQHVTADEILFVDVLADRDRTLRDERYGRLFIITRTDVVFVDYERAVEERPPVPSDGYGQATIVFHPRTPDSLKLISWKDRDLRMVDDRYERRGANTTIVEARAIHVVAVGWEIDLPVERRSDGDDYFARLRKALAT